MRPLILFAILIVAVAIILPFTPWVPPNWSNTINTIRRQVSEQVARFNQPVQPVQPPQPVQPVQPPQPVQPVQPVQPTQPPQPPQPPQPVQPTQPQPPQPPQTEEPTESTTTSVPTNESTTESDEDVNEAAVTTSLTSCYTFTKQDNTVVKVTGQNLLKGVNAIALALLASAGNPHPTTWPSSARKCSGSGDNPPTPGNNSPNSNSVYYGDLNSPRAFRQLSQMKCGNLRGGNGEEAKKYSFFALDNFIYYRICEQGNSQTNYIFFWGTVNGVTSSCFGAAYPAMYKAAVAASPGNPIKVDDFTRLISKGTPLNYAFGNLGAAIGVAETARDHNLAVLNFLLADTHTEATRLLAGHCPPSVKKCNNHNDPQNGVHPLAWGGAKVSMMTGSDWGQQNGATSQFGKNFEASVAADWLIAKRSGAVASDCSGALSISETAKALTPLIEAMTGPINN